MRLFDPQDPMFRPLWVRIAVCAVPLMASAYVFAVGYVLPGALLAGLGGWVFRRLFLP